MASSVSSAPQFNTARTAIVVAGLAAVAAGALLYFHWRQTYKQRENSGTGSRKRKRKMFLEKPQNNWKVMLADNQLGPFVHLRRPGQDPSEPHPYGPEIRALLDNPSKLLLAAASAEHVKEPPSLEEVEYVWVQSRDQLEQLAAELLKVSEFGVDTEQHSQHSFLGYTALLQISTRTCDYVVDTLALHDVMHLLRTPFSSPRITKVFHGSDNDIVWLQRDFHIYTVNVFDTYRAAIALDKPQKSLAFLLQCYCGVTSDKRFQRSDWRRRPLPPELLEYARTDAHYLVYIAERLRAELLEGKARESARGSVVEVETRTARGSEEETATSDEETPLEGPVGGLGAEADVGERAAEVRVGETMSDISKAGDDISRTADKTNLIDKPRAIRLEKLTQVLGRSNGLCLQLYEKEPPGSSSASSLISRHYSTPVGAQHARAQNPEEGLRFRECVRALYDWRDRTARAEDESLRAVLTDAALVAVALTCPKTPSDLFETVRRADRRAASKPAPHPFLEVTTSPSLVLERNAAAVCEIIARFSTSPAAQLYNFFDDEVSVSGGEHPASEGTRGIPPGGNSGYAKGRRSGHEPSGWARVDDESLTKKVHPAKQHRDPAAARARFVSKFACKKTVYENCRIYAGDGRLLCYCDRKKLDWYVQKGLAEFCGDNPPSITLRFEPKGRPEDENNEFYISSKSNRCVACGETSHYLRFRLVPSCYRQHFPEHLKSHRSHDIVLLCVDCHEVAHKATERHKKLVARKFGVPLIPAKVQGSGTAEEAGSGTEGVDPDGLRRAATALIMHGSVMPKERVAELEQIMKDYYGKESLTHQDLMEARLIGMGPKGQRRVYKKKGSRLDAPSGRSETEPSEEEQEAAESVQRNGSKDSLKNTEGVGSGVEGAEMGACADIIGEEGEDGEGQRSGEEARREGAANGAREHSAGDEANGTEGNGAEFAEDLAEGNGRETGRNGAICPGDVENGSEGGGAERSQTEEDATAGTDRAGREEDEAGHNEAETDPNRADSAGDGADGLPHSRRNGIMSRRQRQRMRAELSGGGLELGAGEKARRAEAVLGHGQHGRRVVEILEATGGEDTLREFVQEWRACFVEALRPTYLPPAWDVKHSGKREFGEFSVYKPKEGQEGEDLGS